MKPIDTLIPYERNLCPHCKWKDDLSFTCLKAGFWGLEPIGDEQCTLDDMVSCPMISGGIEEMMASEIRGRDKLKGG